MNYARACFLQSKKIKAESASRLVLSKGLELLGKGHPFMVSCKQWIRELAELQGRKEDMEGIQREIEEDLKPYMLVDRTGSM